MKYSDMTKRFFSLVTVLTLALGAWADDIVSNQVITFDSNTSPNNGIYLHGTFSIDETHAASTSGTFTGTSTEWSLTSSKLLASSQGADLSNIGNISAESSSGPAGSIAFNYSKAGKLYIIYGATTKTDGLFCIYQKGSADASFSRIYNEVMKGTAYTGVLGTRSDGSKYTQAEAIVDLTGSGTVYFGGSQPYCIYAVLFVPEPLSIYGIYDLQSMATGKVAGESGEAAISLIDRAETANGNNTDIRGKLTENGAISLVYRKTDDSSRDFKWNKSANAAETGLQMPRGGAGELSFYINNLKVGDWFKIYTGDNHLLFNNADFYDLNEGSSTSVSKGGVVESGHTYVAKKDVAALQLYYDTKQQGYLYIYKVEISNGDAVPAPIISDYDFDSGKVTITVANSYKGNTPTIYYGIGDAEPTTAYSGPVSISAACTMKAIAKVGDLESTVTTKDIVLEIVSDPEISSSGTQLTITGGTSNAGKTVSTYYTLDGSTPSESSLKYTGSVTLSDTRIVKAMSISESGVKSLVVTQKVVVAGLAPSTIMDFANDEALSPLKWGEDHMTGYYNNGSDKSDGNFKYITNSPVHARIMWQSDKNDTENANNNAGKGIEGISNGRAFAINDLAVGDVIYITYTTTGDKLTTSKHSTKGNTVKIGEIVAEGDHALTTVESGAKIEVTAIDADNNYVMFMPNNKMNITRIAINPKYSITATAEHGTISVTSPLGATIESAFEHGASVTLTATPESSEWVFSHWVVNGNQDASATLTLVMDNNMTVEAVFKQKVSADGVPVILVAGQSNTDGRIQISETAFPYNLNHTLMSYCNGVNYTNEGAFEAYGTTPKSDSGERWGYDAIIYNKVQEALGGNTDFYVIKQSKGNTAVNSMAGSNGQHWWSANPVWLDRNTSVNQGGRSLLKGLLDNIDKSLKQLEDAGKAYDIKFLMWHQGEADRKNAAEYETQLKAVIAEVRNYLVKRTNNNKYSSLPMILGGIVPVPSDVKGCEYNETVENGKKAIAASDANVYYADVSALGSNYTEYLRSDNVHFNATGAGKIADTVWDIITTNGLMTGITLSGTDTPAENPLKEKVVNETTTWTFSTTGALVEHQDLNGLYNHRGTVNKKEYGTITLADGSTLDGTYASTTNAADRGSSATQGLTAGYSGLTYIYNVNVGKEGTFMAVLRPLGIKDASKQQYARLMLNGEELQAVKVESANDNIQLVGKTTGSGTFTITCGESWDFIGAKFIAGASSIEILTQPTIEAGDKINTVKIIPGTSDQSDAVVTTYYTIDDSTPTAESTPYTPGTEIELTEDCIVRAVSISSKGGIAFSTAYIFEKRVAGQVISASTKFQCYMAEGALDFTGLTNIEAYIVKAPSDMMDAENEPKNAQTALSRADNEAGVPSGLQLVRVYKVPRGTAFLVKSLDTTTGEVTVPYMVEDIKMITTATETMAASENLLKQATQAVYTNNNRLYEGNATADSYSFNKTTSVNAGKFYLEVSPAAVGEKTVSILVKDEDTPYLVEIDTYETSPGVVYEFSSTTDHINADDNSKKRTLDYGENSGSFRYVLNSTDKLRVLTYGSTGKFTQGTGLWLDGSNRPFAIEGVKAGDMIRIIHNGTVTDANATSTGTAIADINGKAFTDEIASGKAIMVSKADADNDYVALMAASKNLTISIIAINHALAPRVEKDSEQSGKDKYVYKVSVYEGETLHYTSPDADGEQTVSYTGNGTTTIIVTKDGELSCWATYGNTESEKVTRTVDFTSETEAIAVNAGYQTYYAESALDFTNVEKSELRAYIVRNVEGGMWNEKTRAAGSQLELVEVTKVPAKTALILWAKKTGTVEVPLAAETTAAITQVDGTEVSATVNLLKKAEKTEMAGAEETFFVPNTEGTLSFDYSTFVTRNGIYIEIPTSIVGENAQGITLGEPQEDGSIVPLETAVSVISNVKPVLDEESSNKSKKVYIFNIGSEQKLYYKRAGQDTEFRSSSYKAEGISVSNGNSGFMEYYVQEGSNSSRTEAKAIMLVPTANLTAIGTTSSTYSVDFFDAATLYYVLGDDAEKTVETGSPFELTVTKGAKLTAYSKIQSETTESLSANVYAPTPAMDNDSIYSFGDLKDELGVDYVLNTTGWEDETITLDDIVLKKPNALTSQTLDRFAFAAPRADGKGESTDWRLLNAGRLRATKSANDKYLAILNLEEGKYVTLTYSGGASVKYDASGSAKLEDGTTVLTSKQSYKVTEGGTLLLYIPADESNNCDITIIRITDTEYKESSKDSSSSGSSDSSDKNTSSNAVTIEAYDVNVEDDVVYYRLTWEKGSEMRYILDSEGTEHSAGTSGTYELMITKADLIQMWTISGKDTTKVISAGLFMPLPAMTIKGSFDFAESSEELPVDLEVTLNKNRAVKIGNQELYMPSMISEKLFDDRFAFSEVTAKNKIRIRRNRTLMFSKGDDLKMGILNLKEGDIIAMDFSGVIKMQNGTDAVLESEQSAKTRAGSSDLTMRSGKSYVMQHDGDLLLDIILKDSAVTVNRIYVGSVAKASEPVAFDFVSAAEEFETIETGCPSNVYYYNKEKAQVFRWLTNDSDNLPLYRKVSSEGGNGTLTTNGLTASNRRLAIHQLAKGDEIKVRFSGGAVTFEGHEQNGNVISVNGKRLAPQDTLRSGDVIKVEQVDYLYNYTILKLDSKVSVSGIFINTAEKEKVSMPTIVDKGNNIFVITAGVSSTGSPVTTCYTTDGSEPTRTNGTSGPYDEFDVELLGGGLITVKAVSYTDDGLYSKVAELIIYADDRIGRSGKSNTRRVSGTYDMQGNKVESMQPGRLYIRDGKVVFFGR